VIDVVPELQDRKARQQLQAQAHQAQAQANEEGIENGLFEHRAIFPSRDARCVRGKSLAGWTQLEGEGAIVGKGPSGGNCWRLLIKGRAKDAKAAMGQTFRTQLGVSYDLVFAASATETDVRHVRALLATVTDGALASASSSAPLSFESVVLPNFVIERALWHSARVSFVARSELTSATFAVAAPTSVAFVAEVSCERAMPSLDLNLSVVRERAKQSLAIGLDPTDGRGPDGQLSNTDNTARAGGEAGAQGEEKDTGGTQTSAVVEKGFFDSLSSIWNSAMTPRAIQKETPPTTATTAGMHALLGLHVHPPSKQLAASYRETIEMMQPLSTAETTVQSPCIFTRPDGTQGLVVSTASLNMRSPFIFVPAISVARRTPGQRVVSYPVHAVLGLTASQVECGASREPAVAWKTLADYQKRQGDSRMA